MTRATAWFAVFGFGGTHEALKAEEALLDAGVDVVLIPTPRALGSSCGFAVRVPVDQRDAARAVCAEAKIEVDAEIEIEDRLGR